MTWLSLILAVITIVLTFKTKKLIPSLFIRVLADTLLKEGLLGGITAIDEYMMGAIADKESAYTLYFLITFGSLAELIKWLWNFRF